MCWYDESQISLFLFRTQDGNTRSCGRCVLHRGAPVQCMIRRDSTFEFVEVSRVLMSAISSVVSARRKG